MNSRKPGPAQALRAEPGASDTAEPLTAEQLHRLQAIEVDHSGRTDHLIAVKLDRRLGLAPREVALWCEEARLMVSAGGGSAFPFMGREGEWQRAYRDIVRPRLPDVVAEEMDGHVGALLGLLLKRSPDQDRDGVTFEELAALNRLIDAVAPHARPLAGEREADDKAETARTTVAEPGERSAIDQHTVEGGSRATGVDSAADDHGRSEVRPSQSSQVSAGAWSDIWLRFIDGHTLTVRVGGRPAGELSADEIGLMDRRASKEPRVRNGWRVLELLAEEGGTLARGAKLREGHDESQVTRDDVKQLRDALRRRWPLKADPLPAERGNGWRAAFTILAEPPE